MPRGGFEHLPKPFTPGSVIPSNRSPGEWHWTVRCALGEEYYWRVTDYALASDAKLAMRRWCAASGNTELLQYLDTKKYPGSGRGIFSGRPPKPVK